MTPLLDTDDDPCPRCGGTVVEHLIDVRACCVYCGILYRLREPPPPDPGDFRFEAGRFAGLTLREALDAPNGRRYLDHLAKSDPALAARISALDAENPAETVVRTAE